MGTDGISPRGYLRADDIYCGALPVSSMFIAVGDALSQVLGQIIHIRVHGRWRRWSMTPNESVSGAAHRWAIQGHFPYVKRSIDALFRVFGDHDHCAKAYSYDYYRAAEYRKEVDRLGGPTHELRLEGNA
jgi:hypothetical protein